MNDRTHKLQKIQNRIVATAALLLLLLLATSGHGQERTVSGMVDTLDGPLMGAAVVLKGTDIGVATDQEGKFVFPQPLDQDDVLVISYLGYETFEQTISANTSYIRPFMEDIAVVIVGAARTAAIKSSIKE